MPPVTRGARGRDVLEANLVGRGRGHGRRPRNWDFAGNDQYDQDVGIGNNQDIQADQAVVLQRILERLDNIETLNQIPSGAANIRIPLVQGNNPSVEDDPVARAQLKDLSKMKGPLFYGTEQGTAAEAWLLNIEQCFILHRYLSNVKVRWTILHLRGFGSLWWE